MYRKRQRRVQQLLAGPSDHVQPAEPTAGIGPIPDRCLGGLRADGPPNGGEIPRPLHLSPNDVGKVSRRDRQHRDRWLCQPPERYFGRKSSVLRKLPQQRYHPEPVSGHDMPPAEFHRVTDCGSTVLARGNHGTSHQRGSGCDGSNLRSHVFVSSQLRPTDTAHGVRSPHPPKPLLSARQLGSLPAHRHSASERKDRGNWNQLCGLSR
mmetsp:Transcript_25371/g.55721  ORF Transcript_25371/g.55721 Transcript_25371/m.55721 type:complete len:208 (+) Transcript_25371:429-1052(+)